MDSIRKGPLRRPVLLGFIVMVLGASWDSAAESSHAKFNRVGSETGPPPEVITAMLQDRFGFFWIGSREGLFRYDGEAFVTYRADPDQPGSISGNTVRAMFEDRAGNLWFGTNSAGLNRFDPATGRFDHFRHESGNPASLSHDSVYEIAQDAAGGIWVATQQGLNLLDEETGTFTRFLSDPDDPHSLSHDYITCMLIDREDRIWLGTNGGGLDVFDPSIGRFTHYLAGEENPDGLPMTQVFALLETGDGTILVGGQGLSEIDPETGWVGSFAPTPDDPEAYTQGLVVDLAAGKTGNIWIATFGRGLHSLDPATGETRMYRHDPTESHSLGEDKTMILKVDATDSLWVGTWGAGVWRLTPEALQLAQAASGHSPPDDLKSSDVTGLAIDRNGDLWVGTRFGDLMHKEPDTPGFRQAAMTTAIVNDIEVTDDGLVWVAKANGLQRLNPTTGTTTFFEHDPTDESSLGPGYVTSLLEDHRGRLWVGSGEGGLQRLDSRGVVVERFLHDPDNPRTLSDNYVKALAQDAAGAIWVGTRSGGLNAFDPATGQVRRFRAVPGDLESLSYHYVTTIFHDSRDRLWIGTDGGGLNEKRTRDDGSVWFDRISSADGLIDDAVMAILEDDDGSLWLSTKRGLSRYDPESRRFSHLYVGDGLPAGAFEPGAAARSADTLYFGSVRWLVAVPAGTPFPQHSPSPVLVTSIRDIDGELVGDQPPWLRTQLEVPFGSLISITVAVLDFNVEHHHGFQFRLGDEDEPWVDLGSRREITFLDLDPGIHEFSARAHNCQGVWAEIPHMLTVHVPPPFWMTMWFRVAVLILIGGMVLGWHRMRTVGLRRRNAKLIELHEQTERAQAKLGLAYNRLRTLSRRLEGTKEEERQRIARELHDEMGPALTAVIINLQLIGGSTDEKKKKGWLNDSIEIVDRMVQQVRDLSLALRPPLIDEVGFLTAIRAYLETQAERTGLRIRVDAPNQLDRFPAEVEITAFRVIQEAVSNVIRHADASEVAVSIAYQSRSLMLSIVDDGVGFESDLVVDTSAPGSSLGLVGMQERVQILGGECTIESTIGHGTKIDVRIPVEVRS